MNSTVNFLKITVWVVAWLMLSQHPLVRAEESIDYTSHIKPILAGKCYACHGVLKQQAELRLETRALMMSGGDSGAVLTPGNALESLLFQRVTDDIDQRMPPEGEGTHLNAEETRMLKLWIDQGAIAPDEAPPVGPREHWSFLRIERPEVPREFDAMHPIDALLEVRRKEHGLIAQPSAPRSILLRRLYLDLIGLPPTRQQLHDKRSWEEIVDELLSSPHHGERWARHWMDIWRYADWHGLGQQLRYSQKHIWRWRDWIIESLNEDKPYDRMIVEMLAGDEVAPNDPQTLRATGFLARNYFLFNRTTWLDNTIEHTGKAFLGLTLNCAKCHDHKYDPISQRDYYQFRAIFEPHQVRLDQFPGESDFDRDGIARVFDDHLDLPTYLHVRGDPKNPDKETVIEPAVPKFFRDFAPAIEPVDLPAFAFAPGARDYVQQDRLNASKAEVDQFTKELASAEKALAVAKAQEKDAVKSKSDEAANSISLHDDFDQIDADRWEVVGDGWICEDGLLKQTTATREKHVVKLRQPLPKNFQVNCRYTTTGGTTYKSVTFRFDQSPDFSYENFVYTSAHAPGPKVHIAYARQSNAIYPGEGMKSHPIEVGRQYELRFAVRDRLVNVWLDDEFMVAYALPDRRDGSFSIAGFDATVAFDSITIESLDEKTKLTAARNGDGKGLGTTGIDPQRAFKLAELRLAAAKARLAGVEATIAADNARFREPVSTDQKRLLAKEAARQQATASKLSAQHELLLAAEDSNKQKAAKQKIELAEKRLAAIAEGKAGEVTEAIADYKPLSGSRKALETPEHKFDDYDADYPRTSSGRRTALAGWIVARDNPLTARVAVNQVWMRHFGKPLVESVADFGLRAARPEHADLLDFLAIEFIESGWSFRHLHRLIVTSEAYRLTSSAAGADEETVSKDHDNKSYWRMPARRMESQVVRDSLLSVSGKLDATIGGPPVKPNTASNRRSLYFVHSGDDHDKFISMFDDVDLLQCYRRNESIVPQQALALANSNLALTMADAIAARIVADDPKLSRTEFIGVAFETLLARMPNENELKACEDFCDQLAGLVEGGRAEIGAIQQLERKRLIHALLNHNDFISIR